MPNTDQNSNRKQRNVVIIALIIAVIAIVVAIAFLQTRQANLETYVDNIETAQSGMTLWQTIQAGGLVMVFLGILSMITVALITFMFMKINVSQLVPMDFSHELLSHVHASRYASAHELCTTKSNLLSQISSKPIEQMKTDGRSANDSLEISARREISSLWQWVGYLSDIAAIAPMLGLLGTVIGMIQAFNTIAFESAAVKPILLAGGVSKAMVTTAAGMVIAIVAMMFYSIFRTRVQEITNRVEVFTTDMAASIARKPSRSSSKNGSSLMRFSIDEHVKAKPTVPLAPLIDIVFITLIFYMTLSIFYQLENELSISVPKSSESKEVVRSPGEIIINIDSEGLVIVNQKTFANDELQGMLSRISQLYPNQPVIIRADQKTYHESVVKVLDACAAANIWNIAFSTLKEES